MKDLKEHDAEEYLIVQNKMSSDLAKHLVESVGGCMVTTSYTSAVSFYQQLDSNLNDKLIYDSIKRHLFARFIAPINNAIVTTAPNLHVQTFVSIRCEETSQ